VPCPYIFMENANANVKLYGLLGKNISYSLSPIMHNAAFKHFALPAEYKLFDRDINLSDKTIDNYFMTVVKQEDMSGLNVTVPYKIHVYDMIKTREDCVLDEEANR